MKGRRVTGRYSGGTNVVKLGRWVVLGVTNVKNPLDINGLLGYNAVRSYLLSNHTA